MSCTFWACNGCLVPITNPSLRTLGPIHPFFLRKKIDGWMDGWMIPRIYKSEISPTFLGTKITNTNNLSSRVGFFIAFPKKKRKKNGKKENKKLHILIFNMYS
jgi:hypothetical protein